MQPRLLDPREVSEILHLSRSYIYQLVRSRRLASVRIGRLVRVHPLDLEAYMHRNRLAGAQEVKAYLARYPGSR